MLTGNSQNDLSWLAAALLTLAENWSQCLKEDAFSKSETVSERVGEMLLSH